MSKSDSNITYLMYLLWSYDPKINRKYDLNSFDDRKKYAEWFNLEGAEQRGLSFFVDFIRPTDLSSKQDNRNIVEQRFNQNTTFGVNLVGYATGDLGIGEDVRMMVKCLEKTDIPFCVINKKPGKEISQTDNSIVHYICQEPKYNITIVCLTGIETIDLYLSYPDLFDTFVIGYWPWELPMWPEKWDIVYTLVNEIWVSSKYTQQAYSNSPVPVKYMPMAVSVDGLKKKYLRIDFNLPQEHFLFLFVFDFMSYPERKNPYACIKAFKKAFPNGDEKTNLILKISNIQKENKEWEKLKKHCKKDSRILIIDKTYSREALLGLFDVCDVYLSLHRSEGFGRTMAEALILGKPVIATNFSGNVDFINDKNAFPVKYKLIPIKEDEYPGCENQYWADASINDAAEKIKNLYHSNKSKGKKSDQEAMELLERYQAKNCAPRYQNRLKKLATKAQAKLLVNLNNRKTAN